jgi:hypothetical protein
MTTGSYEESLSIEGIPDHRHERFLSREGVQDGLGSSQHPPTHTNPPKEVVRRKIASLEKSREAVDEKELGTTTGVSEARSHQHRGKKTPTLMTPRFKTQSQDWEHESVREC